MALSIGVPSASLDQHIVGYAAYADMYEDINAFTNEKSILHTVSVEFPSYNPGTVEDCESLFNAERLIGFNNTAHDLTGTVQYGQLDTDLWDVNVYSRLMGAMVAECSEEITGAQAEKHEINIDINHYKQFPIVPQVFDTSATSFVFNAALLLALMTPVVTVVSDIVSERQSGMAQYFHVMGSMDTAEMFALVMLNLVIISLNVSVMYIASQYLDGLTIFKESDYWAIYMVVVPAGMAFVAMGLFFAQLFTRVKTSILVVMFLLIVLFVTSLVLVFFAFIYDWILWQEDLGYITSEDDMYLGKGMTRFLKVCRRFLPGYQLDVLMTGVGWLTSSTTDATTGATTPAVGFHWADLTRTITARENAMFDFDEDVVMTLEMSRNIGYLVFMALMYIVLALYLNVVLRKGYGAPSPPWFFLMPSFWTGTDPKAFRNPETACPDLPVTLLSDIKDDFRDPLPLEPVRPLDPTVMTEAARLHLAEKQRLRAIDRHEIEATPLIHTDKRLGTQAETEPSLIVPSGPRKEEEPALLLKGIGKTYGTKPGNHVHAVKALWLSVKQRTCFGLLGSNGSGKSTLISMLTGSTGATRGGARVCGFEIRGQMSQIRRNVGIEFQEDRLYPAVTCMQHGMIVALMKGLSIKEGRRKSIELLASVGLGMPLGDKKKRVSNMRARELSGGMKRRLSFCLAMLGNPKILFLDEPTSSLDPNSRRHMWEIIAE
eukprot:g7936.t1